MGSNEEDILLESEDKIATLKHLIDAWKKAADNSESRATRQYCAGRAVGLEVCLPTIKKLEDKITTLSLETIDLLLKDVD